MTRNYWKLCNSRTQFICRTYNITAEIQKGNARCGISYSVSFWCGDRALYELRSMSAKELFNMLCAFDWGLYSAGKIHDIRNDNN